MSTKIEYVDKSINFITGCTKVSPGCQNCYAKRMALRLQAMGQPNYRNGFQVTLHPDALRIPFRWKKSHTIFVNSMSDLFHREVPSAFISEVFGIMGQASHHRFRGG